MLCTQALAGVTTPAATKRAGRSGASPLLGHDLDSNAINSAPGARQHRGERNRRPVLRRRRTRQTVSRAPGRPACHRSRWSRGEARRRQVTGWVLPGSGQRVRDPPPVTGARHHRSVATPSRPLLANLAGRHLRPSCDPDRGGTCDPLQASCDLGDPSNCDPRSGRLRPPRQRGYYPGLAELRPGRLLPLRPPRRPRATLADRGCYYPSHHRCF